MKNIPPINGSGNRADFEITTEPGFDFLKAVRLEISQITGSAVIPLLHWQHRYDGSPLGCGDR